MIGYIISGLILISGIGAGISLLNSHEQMPSKQALVKQRRSEFGVVSNGTSMNDDPVYVVPYHDLGVE